MRNRQRWFWAIVTIISGVNFASLVQASGIHESTFVRQDTVSHPANNKPTEARIELGKILFFDKRLSGDEAMSCATCHDPAKAWTDGRATAIGHRGKKLERATPTIINSGYSRLQMWDGRFKSLEEQALAPLSSGEEMNADIDEVIQRLKSVPQYVALFGKAYPEEGITAQTVAKAIAAFERTIVATASPFDRYLAGDHSALNDSAKRGFDLFRDKARCFLCHQGHNFADDGFHNLGFKRHYDPGRFVFSPVKINRGAFKTPTLRDVALTAPYMHFGIYKTLNEVVEHYDRGGDDAENLDPNIQPLGLSAQEKNDLVAFLNSLTGTQVPFKMPKVP